MAITKDAELDLAGRDVVVEDILASGFTARMLMDHLARRRPRLAS